MIIMCVLTSLEFFIYAKRGREVLKFPYHILKTSVPLDGVDMQVKPFGLVIFFKAVLSAQTRLIYFMYGLGETRR